MDFKNEYLMDFKNESISSVIVSLMLFFTSCQSSNQERQKIINDSSKLTIQRSSLLDTPKIKALKNLKTNDSQDEVPCDSLLNLLCRSSSYDRSMQLDYVENDFDNGILYIQVFDPGGRTLFGNLDLDMKSGILSVDKPGAITALQYDKTLFNRLIKHC